MRSGVEATRRGVEAIAVGQPYETWANAVQSTCEGEFGFHSVAGLGGHGIGRRLHNPPFIANHLRADEPWAERRDVWKPGLLVALEPMVAAGTSQRRDVPGDWPIFTADGSMSVHYEADVLVTADGPRNLTEGMFGLPEVVG
jgi:methionyl aminopeptidase